MTFFKCFRKRLSALTYYFVRILRFPHVSCRNPHWVKDVVLKEDYSPLCDGNALINFAIVRTIALNLFRHHGFGSITQGLRRLAHDGLAGAFEQKVTVLPEIGIPQGFHLL